MDIEKAEKEIKKAYQNAVEIYKHPKKFEDEDRVINVLNRFLELHKATENDEYEEFNVTFIDKIKGVGSSIKIFIKNESPRSIAKSYKSRICDAQCAFLDASSRLKMSRSDKDYKSIFKTVKDIDSEIIETLKSYV